MSSKVKTPIFWESKNIKSLGLLPFSHLYKLGTTVDRFFKEKEKYRPSVPVVSVGNIGVGGSGKTPIVSMLAEHFTEKGYKVAILCRGYGAKITGNKKVDNTDSAESVGDEPYMMFKQGVADAVWAGVDRRKSAKLAEESGATLLILDDGFQHWRLERDVDIVAIGPNGLGNGYVLPAGPLRESEKALSRADLVVSLKGNDFQTNLAHNVKVERGLNTNDLAPILGRDVFAFCGIGHPQQFYAQLANSEIKIVGRKTYPDHYPYTELDLKELMGKAGTLGAQLVTTEKDAVKLSDAFRKRVRVVRPSFDDASKASILQMVEKLLARAERELKNTKKSKK